MCDPLIIPTIAKIAVGALANSGPALALAAAKAAPAIIGGYSAYEGKRARDRAGQAIQDAKDAASAAGTKQADAIKTFKDDAATRAQETKDAIAEERTRQDKRDAIAAAEREEIRRKEEARQGRITAGRSAVSDIFDPMFNQGFYDKQQQAFLDYQNPQLEDQYKDAGQELLFALTRTGLGQSSAMNQRQAKLTDTYTQAGQGIVDEAARRKAQTQAAVNAQRMALMNQAEGAHDPSYMRGLAQSQGASLAAPQSMSNLGDIFATALSGITSAYDQERRKQAIADRMKRGSTYGIGGEGASNIVGQS